MAVFQPVQPYNLDIAFSICTFLNSFSHLQGIPGSSVELPRNVRTSGGFCLALVLLRTAASMHGTFDHGLGCKAISTIKQENYSKAGPE